MVAILQTRMLGLPGAEHEAPRVGDPAHPLPAPGSRELAVVLMRVRSAGLPVVGVGHRYGPRVPQIRAPRVRTADLARLTPEALDADAAAVAQARWSWAQASWANPAIPRDEVNLQERGRGAATCVPLRRWQPSRHASLCLGASAARRLDGLPDERIGELYNIAGATPARADSRRFRDLPAIVRRGDACWAQLGAWPWAAFEDGRLPDAWWTTDAAWSSLRAFLDGELRAARAGAPASRSAGLRSAA